MKDHTDKKNKSKLIAGIAMMVFAIALSAGTYAFYQSTITGTASGTIVAWECKAGGGASTFTLDLGNLKPNMTKTVPINLSVKNFKATFKVSLSEIKVGEAYPYKLHDDVKFYTNATTKTADTCLSRSGSATTDCKLASTSTTLDATSTGSATGEINLYMVWPKGNAEKGPTTASTKKIQVNLTCTQENVTPKM